MEPHWGYDIEFGKEESHWKPIGKYLHQREEWEQSLRTGVGSGCLWNCKETDICSRIYGYTLEIGKTTKQISEDAQVYIREELSSSKGNHNGTWGQTGQNMWDLTATLKLPWEFWMKPEVVQAVQRRETMRFEFEEASSSYCIDEDFRLINKKQGNHLARECWK